MATGQTARGDKRGALMAKTKTTAEWKCDECGKLETTEVAADRLSSPPLPDGWRNLGGTLSVDEGVDEMRYSIKSALACSHRCTRDQLEAFIDRVAPKTAKPLDEDA